MRPPLYRRIFPLGQKLPRAARMAWKESLRLFDPRAVADKRIVFIVGCQRSGTTLLTHIFERDRDSRVFGEWSRLSSQDADEGLRLNSLDDVGRTFSQVKFPLIVAKPLVESQRIRELLGCFGNSTALWLFRHYSDVASSNLAEFGLENGVNDLRPIVDAAPGNWRSEGVSEETRAEVRRLFREDMSAVDAAALFWYTRNRLFFDLELADHPGIMMLRYEHFVSDPVTVMNDVYEFIGRPFPGPHVVEEVRASSVGKGKRIELSDDVRALCEDLHLRLIDEHAARGQRVGAGPQGA